MEAVTRGIPRVYRLCSLLDRGYRCRHAGRFRCLARITQPRRLDLFLLLGGWLGGDHRRPIVGDREFGWDRSDRITISSITPTGANGNTDGAIRASFSRIIEVVAGTGLGIDTIEGSLAQDRFRIDSAGAGLLDSDPATSSLRFRGIELIDARAGDDAILFDDAGSVASLIGGTGVDAVFGKSTADVMNLTATGAGTLSAGSLYTTFSEIESFDGRSGDDSLELNAISAGLAGSFIGSAGIDTIRGRDSRNDYFSVDSVTSAGAAGRIGSSVNSPADVVANFTGIEVLDGRGNEPSTTGDSLQSTTGNDLFAITGDAQGTLNSFLTWNRIENLVGGEGDDSFLFDDAGTIGSVTGGQGIDSIVGKTVSDTFEVTGISSGIGRTLSTYVRFEGIDRLDGQQGADRFVVTPTGVIQQLIGGASDDTFEIQGIANSSGAGAFGRVGTAGIGGIDGGGGRDTLVGGDDQDRFVVLASGPGAPPFNLSVSGELQRKRDLAPFDVASSFELKVSQFANIESMDGSRPTGLEIDLASFNDPANCRVDDRGDVLDLSRYQASGIRFNFNGRVESGNRLVGLLQQANSSAVLATFADIESAIGTRFADEFLKTFTADGRPFGFDSIFAGGPGVDAFRTRNNNANDVLLRSGDNLEDTDPAAIDPRCDETGDGITIGVRDQNFSAPLVPAPPRKGETSFMISMNSPVVRTA